MSTPARVVNAPQAPRQGRRRPVVQRAPHDTPSGPLTYVALVLTMLLSAFPLYWAFVVGSSTDEELSKLPPSVVPGNNLGSNVRQVFTQDNVYFVKSLANSVIVTLTVTASVLFFCSLAGFAFAKLRFKGRNVLFVALILTMTVPNQLGIVALYILMSKFGWNGTLPAVIVPGLVSAFGVFFMRQFALDSVPDELIESGRLDGASTFRIFWSIALPSMRPALSILGLLTFVATWNDFQWPLVTLGGSENPTVQVALSN
ncbi:MAG TPA: carbohydrate ABC transporter permease, partial [Candidatus Lustribacter sp.]|nr:carbohydrate ABC transporter permease [Candidatus Lustribacter sp.]